MAESEADTPSTPIEFESKYFEFDGVRLPPFCRGKMEEIAGFSLRSSDIWIVTYPKSGKQPVMSACEAALRTDTLLSARAQRFTVPCTTKGWRVEVWLYNAFINATAGASTQDIRVHGRGASSLSASAC